MSKHNKYSYFDMVSQPEPLSMAILNNCNLARRAPSGRYYTLKPNAVQRLYDTSREKDIAHMDEGLQRCRAGAKKKKEKKTPKKRTAPSARKQKPKPPKTPKKKQKPKPPAAPAPEDIPSLEDVPPLEAPPFFIQKEKKKHPAPPKSPAPKKQKQKQKPKVKTEVKEGKVVHIGGPKAIGLTGASSKVGSKLKKLASDIRASQCDKNVQFIERFDRWILDSYIDNVSHELNRVARSERQGLAHNPKIYYDYIKELGYHVQVKAVRDEFKTLRENNELQKVKDFIEFILYRIVATARCMRAKNDMIVYRAVMEETLVTQNAEELLLKNLRVGTTYIDPAPTSTSTDEFYIKKWIKDYEEEEGNKGYILVLKLPKNTPMIELSDFGDSPIILPPGTRYRINEIDLKTKIVKGIILPSRSFINYKPKPDAVRIAELFSQDEDEEPPLSEYNFPFSALIGRRKTPLKRKRKRSTKRRKGTKKRSSRKRAK